MKKYLFLFIFGVVIGWMNQADAVALNTESLRGLLEQSGQYEFGQSRRALTEIENQIKSVYDVPEEGAKAEMLLLEILPSDCSLALKDFLCRQLSVIGSAHSVPVLAELLNDSKTAALAQYALVRIPSGEADRALIDHLATAKADVRVGLLTCLGLRKSPMAVEAVAPFVVDENRAVAEAALSALGQIGTLEAAAALQKELKNVDSALQPRAYDALLACGENLLKSNQKTQAAALFRTIYETKDLSGLLRSAALQRLLESLPAEEADRWMLEGLEGTDLQVRTVCLLSACRLNRASVLKKGRDLMPSLPEWQQVQFLTALAEAPSATAKEIALAALSSQSAEVILAATETLSTIGDAWCVQPLIQTAVQSSDRGIRQAAQLALERLSDPQTDSVIAQWLEQADFASESQSAYAVEWIGSAGRRATRAALPAILKAAASENRSVRRAALEALASIAEPGDLDHMTFLLEKPDSDVIKLMVTVASKQSERKGRAQPFLRLLDLGGFSKAALYQILGRLGDPDSLEIVKEGLKSSDPAIQDAAFRGLTEWPGLEVLEEMKRWTAEGKTESQRVLAFRAYVRMVRQSDLPTGQKASTLSEALVFAPRQEEKKIVLAGLADVPHEQSLSAAVSCLAQESIRPEAQSAVLAICRKMAFSQPDVCRDALQKLLDSSASEQIVEGAQELLKRIQRSQ